ncbi:MAG: fumarylacetoacetate hydrolase family protein [Pseudomonadota bacterium]
MGTPIVRYKQRADGAPTWGVLAADSIFPLALDLAGHRELMATYFNERARFDAALGREPVAKAEVSLCSPVSGDIQLFCQGLNYASHRAEGGLKEDASSENLIFAKAPSSICGPADDIVRPVGCQLLDYEIELALVLKSDLLSSSNVSEGDLDMLIGGLVIANDVSSRDDQFGATALQWFKGKSYRTFCPMGPVLYLLDQEDIPQLQQMELTLKLNGEIKQQATTDRLIHKPAATLTEISSFADLRAGDCLLTGTPGGVLLNIDVRTGLGILLNFTKDEKRREKVIAAQLAKRRFLQPGDVLELSIKSVDGRIDLGRQHNTIVAA